MKLYFYIVESNYFANRLGLRCEECEVVEKPKSYAPVTHWPDGVSRVNKSVIGGFVSNYSDIVVLDSKNYEKAKEIFYSRYNRVINDAQNQINKAMEIKEAVDRFGCCSTDGCSVLKAAANKLGEYESAEKENLLLKLPCRVRDAVYVIVGKDVSRQRVNEIRILPGSVKFETSTGRIFDKGAFGDNVFLTRKDAMEKLEKMKK